MSTLPGAESWRDAGLAGPPHEELVELPPEAEEPEDYDPVPSPELDIKEASEGDHVEQLAEVPQDEREDYP